MKDFTSLDRMLHWLKPLSIMVFFSGAEHLCVAESCLEEEEQQVSGKGKWQQLECAP